jgi:ketosteroid isomerase-like protein
MRALVQRVSEASVTVGGEEVARIGRGLLVLLGVRRGDTEAEADRIAAKLLALGESVPMTKFGVGFGGSPDATRSLLVDYRCMATAELVTAHVGLGLEEEGVRRLSQENVELAARWYALWATRNKAELLANIPSAMELCHPEVEWTQRADGRTVRGREAVGEALERWLDSFDEYSFEVLRIFDVGFDEALVVGLEVGRGAISGAEVRSLTHELLTFRDGRIVRFRDFHDDRDALEAAGLLE